MIDYVSIAAMVLGSCLVLVTQWRALERIKVLRREVAEKDRLFRETLHGLHLACEKLFAVRKERDCWRDRWKAGAFELDAATMAKLGDE
jgi:hypothetical protein